MAQSVRRVAVLLMGSLPRFVSALCALLSFFCCSLSFDHPIRARQHIRRNRQTNLFRRFEVDNELKFLWLLHWEIGGLGALQDFVHVGGRAPENIGKAGTVIHESSGIDKL